MTADEYRAALSTLGLTQGQAARWLGVSLKTAHTYAKTGPSGPAGKAVTLALRIQEYQPIVPGLTAALDLPGKEAGK